MKIPSGRVKDLTGLHFGDWEVLEFSHLDSFKCSVWKCKCSCGTIKYLNIRWLKSKNVGSCGCKKSQKLSKIKTQDLTGMKFNRLIALRCVKQHSNGNMVWEWLCDCGNVVEIKAGDVKSGNTKSCGCLKSEIRIQNNIIYKRKPNNHSNKNSKYNHYKNHAKNRKISFKLTKEEFIKMAESKCHYCGVEPLNPFSVNNYSGIWLCNGIDRIDSNIGYQKDNCVPCCKQCNIMKMDYSLDDFYQKIIEIYKYKQLGGKK